MNQVRLVFLGTSAGTPSRERNLAAMALVMDGRALLFDCGEGTQQQILRSSVRAGAIEAIFISHMHGDHLYGLPGLLATMSLHGRSAPLAVFGPERVAQYLRGGKRQNVGGFVLTTEAAVHRLHALVGLHKNADGAAQSGGLVAYHQGTGAERLEHAIVPHPPFALGVFVKVEHDVRRTVECRDIGQR